MSNMKRPILNESVLYTFLQGALGAMTFGAYHQYTTMEIMRINNEKQDYKININNEKQDYKFKTELQNMEIKYENLLKQQQNEIQKLQDEIQKLQK